MSLPKGRRVVLARHVEGQPRVEDFRIETVDVPEPTDGQVLVRNRFLSVDPGTRSRLSGEASYAPPLALGALIDAVLPLMRPHGRIVVSGQIADYNREPGTRPGLTNTNLFIASRLTMRGFVAFDYVKEFPIAWREMTGWIRSGALRYREDIEVGIDRAPGAFIGLFKGENFGRKLIRLD